MDNQNCMVKDFLKSYGMDYESIDMDRSCEIFVKEMEDGLYGIDSSLKMIPTYISVSENIPEGEPVIAIDAGGTNFRVAYVYFDSAKKSVIEDYRMYPMPGAKGEITKEEFYETIGQYIRPMLNKSSKIGFCFSFPTEILPNKDGKLLQLSKEVRIRGLIGDLIGENLSNAIKKMASGEGKSIVMLNDTVATIIGGKASYPEGLFDSYIGFILGTGTNSCYIEENRNIKKLEGVIAKEGSMIINVESGGYRNIKRGTIDREFDSKTIDPGEYSFEKMVSGRYQGGLMLEVIKKAAQDGLFSLKFCQGISNIKELTSPDIDDFLCYPYSKSILSSLCSDKTIDDTLDDHLVLYYLIDSMIERAAKLVTINLASIMIKTGKGKNPCKPVCIAAEGSTFYKLKSFRSKLDYYVKTYMNDEKGLYPEFIKLDDVTLIGTAIAGLTN